MITRLTLFSAALLLVVHTAAAILVETEIPASNIKPTASSVYQGSQVPARLIDGSGLNGETHDNSSYGGTMWHMAENPAASTVAGIKVPAWVRFDFAKPQSFEKILIWNHNQANLTDRGFRKTKILGTVDGTAWLPLAELELPRANGQAATATTVVVSAKQPLKAVVIAADSNWGGNVYGLSEVKFVSSKDVAEADLPFPSNMECVPRPVYRQRADGQPGREVTLNFKAAKLFGKAQVEAMVDGRTEITVLPAVVGGAASCRVLLPSDVGVKQESQVVLTVRQRREN